MIPAADVNRLPPAGLGLQGLRVWNMVTRLHDDGTPVYRLRPDEMMLLEHWCKAEDMIVRLEANLRDWAGGGGKDDGTGWDFMVPGIQGTVSANPLLTALKGWHAQAQAAAKALKLPDEVADGAEATRETTLREHQSAAQHSRWHGKAQAN